MLALFKNRNNDQNQEPAFKREVSVTGALTDILRPGLPAMYLYQGNLIRTSTVQAILEASVHLRNRLTGSAPARSAWWLCM